MHVPPSPAPIGDQSPQDRLAAALRRAATGDESGLREVYDATIDRVLGMTQRILGDSAAAEEAAVEAFEKVWRDAQRFDSARGSVSGWVLMIARSRAIDMRRTRARRAAREGDLDEDAPDPGGAPTDAVSGDERADLVRAALQDLPDEQRRCVVAAFFDGLSHTEIAQTFSTPLGTVKSRVRAGLATLRMSLQRIEQEVG